VASPQPVGDACKKCARVTVPTVREAAARRALAVRARVTGRAHESSALFTRVAGM